MTHEKSPGNDLAEVERIAREAGAVVTEWFGQVTADRKADGSLATEADRESEKYILAELGRLYPADRFCGEESPVQCDVGPGRVWSFDPLDGTHNFVAGLGVWAVSIGLIERGRPTLGVVHAPPLGLTFSAQAGAGAWLNGERLRPPSARPLRTNDLLAVTSEMPPLELHAPHKTRNLGSAALHACLVASGVFRATLLNQWALWDLAAALCLLGEVGVPAVWWGTGEPLRDLTALHVSQRQGLLVTAPEEVYRELRGDARVGFPLSPDSASDSPAS